MLHLINLIRRLAALNVALLFLLAILLPILIPSRASALLSNRSLSLSSSAIGTADVGTAGQGNNGARAKHTVSFQIPTNPTIGSMLVMYCTSPVFITTCTTPTGLTAANLTSVTVTGLSGSQTFSYDTTNTNNDLNLIAAVDNNGQCNGSAASTTRENCIALNRASAVAETGPLTVSIAYGGGASDYITNPTTANYSFYARVFVFSDTGYSTIVDTGGVAASTAQAITITARVPERLEFSVGVGSPVGTLPAPGTTCAPINDAGALTIGDSNGVLSTNTAYDAYSYFRVNSNTTYGTKIYYSGDTLKNGSNQIDPMPTASGAGTESTPGTKQFGLALDDTEANWSFTDLSKIAAGDYDAGNGTINPAGGTARFAFETTSLTTPVEIANSAAGISCDTGSVRYVANVSTNTPAGIYTTTITYIATGTY